MGVDPKHLDLLRRRVLNVVGHELRTPVTTLSGLAMELEACDDEVTRGELTTAVVRNARRLDHLVEDLLLAAGIETVVPVGLGEPVDLLAAARSLWAGPADAVTGSGSAWARPGVVRRALGELFDNATIHGAPPITIVVSVTDGRAAVEVTSGGPALSPEDLALACELFYRGERAMMTAAGLGIGLALARTLACADGGDIVLRPGPDGGVVARLELPAAE